MVIVICIISVLPWIGLGDFSTKGEPREAAVAVSMLETDQYNKSQRRRQAGGEL